MLKCFHCKGPVPDERGIVINLDFDLVCSEACKVANERAREHFYRDIAPSATSTEQWLRGQIS